ncbi:MAG TPA: cupin domain-containing protein [Propionibacteriaceae bacterium]|nr:cupin domain-containing protein [Propionibacteriaceae bacterium]
MAQALTSLAESASQVGVLDALPVTADSTTSRVLLNNPLLRVVYFAFDGGELLTDHSSPRAVVVQVLSGAIRFTYDGREVAMKTGDLVYLAPGMRHSLIADEPSHLSLVMVDTEALG